MPPLSDHSAHDEHISLTPVLVVFVRQQPHAGFCEDWSVLAVLHRLGALFTSKKFGTCCCAAKFRRSCMQLGQYLVLTECRAAVVRPLSHSYLVPRSKQLIGLMTLNRQMPRSNTNSRSLTFCGVEELNNVTRMSENTVSRMKRKIIAPAIVLFQVHEVAN